MAGDAGKIKEGKFEADGTLSPEERIASREYPIGNGQQGIHMAVSRFFGPHTEGGPKQRALPLTLAPLSSASAVSASGGRGC